MHPRPPPLRVFRHQTGRMQNLSSSDAPCWFIRCPWCNELEGRMLRSGRLMIISRRTGRILYHGFACDEGGSRINKKPRQLKRRRGILWGRQYSQSPTLGFPCGRYQPFMLFRTWTACTMDSALSIVVLSDYSAPNNSRLDRGCILRNHLT